MAIGTGSASFNSGRTIHPETTTNNKENNMLNKIQRNIKKQAKKGQTLVEYGLILALVAVVLIAALTLMKNSISNTFSKVTSELESASS